MSTEIPINVSDPAGTAGTTGTASAGSPAAGTGGSTGDALDVERDSDLPISTQIYWQLAYQIDSGRLLRWR